MTLGRLLSAPMADKIDLEASKNEDHNKLKFGDLNTRLKKIHLGGGEKRIADHKAKGKMSTRLVQIECYQLS